MFQYVYKSTGVRYTYTKLNPNSAYRTYAFYAVSRSNLLYTALRQNIPGLTVPNKRVI